MGLAKKIRVIKRNGEEVAFHLSKIENAIAAANKEVDRLHQMNDYQVKAVAENVTKQIETMTHAVHVEDIQDMVETGIMEMRGYEVAQKYVRYRYKRELTRKSNTTDNGILALIDNINEEVNQENSNKNPVINSTQRDYMAGEVSKDLTRRMLLPGDIVEAHEQGIIHFHDSDYFAQKEHNCDLINLEDMLQNGTVISETMIEKPHSFYGVQCYNTDCCTGGKQPVRRPVLYVIASGAFCGYQPSETAQGRKREKNVVNPWIRRSLRK